MLLAQFYENWRRLDTLYEEYAKTMDLSYTSMKILYYIYMGRDGGITQKTMCEKTALPKQTVHSVIAALMKQGLIELVEGIEDRRVKPIRLTQQGKAFCQESFEKLNRAEEKAMASLTEQEQQMLVSLLKAYSDAFEVHLK